MCPTHEQTIIVFYVFAATSLTRNCIIVPSVRYTCTLACLTQCYTNSKSTRRIREYCNIRTDIHSAHSIIIRTRNAHKDAFIFGIDFTLHTKPTHRHQNALIRWRDVWWRVSFRMSSPHSISQSTYLRYLCGFSMITPIQFNAMQCNAHTRLHSIQFHTHIIKVKTSFYL